MYGIRKFINHINKIIDDISEYYQIDIRVYKYNYTIRNSKNSPRTNVKIYTNKLRINISDCVTQRKKNNHYDYNEIKNNKLIMYNGDADITIIDKCTRIINYDDSGHRMDDIIITHDDI
jgi:hypothetical protein